MTRTFIIHLVALGPHIVFLFLFLFVFIVGNMLRFRLGRGWRATRFAHLRLRVRVPIAICVRVRIEDGIIFGHGKRRRSFVE